MKDNADLRKEAIGQIEVYFNDGNINDGKILIDKYIDSLGKDDNILNAKAIYYILKNEFNIALDIIREGLLFNINNAELYYNMAYIYETIGAVNRAYVCYKEAKVLADKEELYASIKESIERLEEQKKIDVRNTSIVILTYNNLDYTKTCINSIKSFNDMDSYEIIVVDNNSTDGTIKWLKEQEDLKVIFNKENLGFPKGCNQGIELANPKNDIFLLNNDTVIMPNSILNLRMALYSENNIGAVGAISNSVAYYQQVSLDFNNFNDYIKFATKNNIPNDKKHEERLKLVGFAMIIKRSVIDKVGLLDERFTPGNYEDDDLSLRIVQEGYKLLLCQDSYIHHFGSISFKKNQESYYKLLIDNAKKFESKWEFNSQYSLNIRNDVISKISVSNVEKLKVLEVGCACGATLLRIKHFLKDVELYGIEINENSAEIARNIANVISVDVENNEIPFEDEFFDLIILPDVLEHLKDPWDVLVKLKKKLSKNGQIIASIPNIMHITVVDSLLKGRFDYEDAGILDKTHLRFFTLKTIEDMFRNIGFNNTEVSSNKIYINDDLKKKVDILSDLYNLNREELLAYQYIISTKGIA